MERSESLKLHLIGGLSLLGFCISALIFVAAIPVENPTNTGLQFLGVGVMLAFLFALFGGLSDVADLSRTARSIAGAPRGGLRHPPHTENEELPEPFVPDLPILDGTEPSTDICVSTVNGALLNGGPGAELGVSLWMDDVLPSEDESGRQFLDRYESSLIDALLDAGELSSTGPLTDHDVGVMLIAAVARNELDEQIALGRGLS